MNKYYVLSVTVTSKDTEDRKFTPYGDYDTALRKFYEAFSSIGGGSKKISAILFDENLNEVKKDIWVEVVEPEPEEPTEDEETNE